MMDKDEPTPDDVRKHLEDSRRYRREGDLESAHHRLTQAMEESRALGMRSEEAQALLGLSFTVRWVGSGGNVFAQGASLAEQARAIYEELGDRKGIARADMLMGFSLPKEEGVRRLEAAVETMRELGTKTDVAHALDRLAAHIGLSHEARSKELLHEALAIYDSLDPPDDAGKAHILFSLSLRELTDEGKSHSLRRQALEFYRRANNPEGITRMLMMIDVSDLPLEEQIAHHEERIVMCERSHSHECQASGMRKLAECLEKKGEIERAAEIRTKADILAPEVELTREEQAALNAIFSSAEAADSDEGRATITRIFGGGIQKSDNG